MRTTIMLISIICILLSGNAGLFAQEFENVEMINRIYNHFNAFDVVVEGDLAFIAGDYGG